MSLTRCHLLMKGASPVIKRSTQVARLEQNTRITENPAKSESASPLYGVAMLKIAMEMKKPGNRSLDDILDSVLAKMNLPEEEFRGWMQRNGGLLRTIALTRKA